MNIRTASSLVLALSVFSTASSWGQALDIYSSSFDTVVDLPALDTPANLAGDAVSPVMGTSPVPFLAPSAWPAGAITTNQAVDQVFVTNGTTAIHQFIHPSVGCPGPPPVLGAAFPIPPIYNPAVNPVTGMTFDPATGRLYLTDGVIVSAHDPAAWPAPVAGPWFITGINFCVGLDISSCNGRLYGVDPAGNVAEWDVLAGLVTLAYNPWPHGMSTAGALATGLALNRCILSPCGANDYYVSWNTSQVVQFSSGANVPAPFPSQGLSFAGIPQRMPSPASCIGANLRARVSGYVHANGPFDLQLCNVPAGIASVSLAVTLGYLPGGFVPVGCGDTLWLDPAAGIAILAIPALAGTATLPVPALPQGLRLYAQWAVYDPATMTFDLSNALNLETVRI